MTTLKNSVSAEMTGTPVLTCDNVSHEYSRGSSPSRLRPWRTSRTAPTVSALSDVSLSIQPGEIVGITGPSGSGKSTLLHLLAALETPTRGRVTVNGSDTTALSERERTRLRLTMIGIIFQRFYLLPALSARANVALPLVEQGIRKRARRERATSLLERVGLDDRATHKPGELSGGEQQRVAIARALAADPAVLIADEPTGELDTATGARILDLFSELATDHAVVIASHDQPTLDATDRQLHLRDGQLVDSDS